MKIDAELVRKLRAAKPWSQEQLGEASGLSLRTIQRLERNGSASIDSVQALAAALDVSPDALLAQAHVAHMTPLAAVKRGFVNFADFTGTASRYEYWWFFLFVLLLTAVAVTINGRAYLPVALVVLVPLLAAGSRRLNDSGHSGWWQLLFIVPFGFVPVFIILAQAGKAGADAA